VSDQERHERRQDLHSLTIGDRAAWDKGECALGPRSHPDSGQTQIPSCDDSSSVAVRIWRLQ